MIICKEIYTEGRRADDCCPVMIRVSHRGKIWRISTSVYIKECCWDAPAAQVNSDDDDYLLKNEFIDSMFRRVSGHIQQVIDDMLDNRLNDILFPLKDFEEESRQNDSEIQGDENQSESLPTFMTMIDLKIESAVSHNTRRGYEGFRRYVKKRFGDGPFIDEINQDFTNRFIETVNSDYHNSESMRRLMISRYNAIINIGRERGLIPNFLRIALPPYFLLPADRNLTGEEICNIFSAFQDAFHKDPNIHKNETLALGLFVLDIAFQGLAPVDFANIRVRSLNFTTLYGLTKNPQKYATDPAYRKRYDSPDNRLETVTLSTTRKKTGRPVQIIASTHGIGQFIMKLTEGKDADEYLLPCFDHRLHYTPAQKQNRLGNYFNMLARNLNNGISKYYRKHKLGTARHITFYFARHAFCNLVDSLDIPRHIIQHMVGHRSSVLENSYLRPITPWEQAKISHIILTRYLT